MKNIDSDYVKSLFTPEKIAEYERRQVENSIAARFPEGLTDRQIMSLYLQELNRSIIRESLKPDRDEEMIKFMQYEKRAIQDFQRRGDEHIPELHDAGMYCNYITDLEWSEMTPEEMAALEKEIDEMVLETN